VHHPVAPDLYLVIAAAAELKLAIGSPAHQVARAVLPPPGAVRVGHEAGRRGGRAAGLPRYPVATASPPMHSSPTVPTGTSAPARPLILAVADAEAEWTENRVYQALRTAPSVNGGDDEEEVERTYAALRRRFIDHPVRADLELKR